jgi:4-amino-4-deoxy-L-arabinose transferase-like glycosyltransferase
LKGTFGGTRVSWRLWRERVLAFALFVALASLLQWRSGAFTVGMGSHPDEAAHYVTGLMIHDYVRAGNLTNPLAYAEHYYVHLPKIAFGMWPPVFHFIEAFWFLLVSPGKGAALGLVAILTALTAVLLYAVLRERFGWAVALATSAGYVLLPLTQESLQTVMADIQIALFNFAAIVALARYMRSGGQAAAIWFGVFTAASLATKANGLALIPIPVLVCVLNGRWDRLRRLPMLWAGLIIAVVGLPWQFISYVLIQKSGGLPISPEIVARTALRYVEVIGLALGPVITGLLVVGLVRETARLFRRQGEPDELQAGAISLLLCVWAYHSLVGQAEYRYMLGAIPAALVLAASGFEWMVEQLGSRGLSSGRARAALGALVVVTFLLFTWRIPTKADLGFNPVATLIRNQPPAVTLILSSASGEGAFIGEIATDKKRHSHLILRASKVLSSMTWYGTRREWFYNSRAEMHGYLENSSVEWVVVDTQPGNTSDPSVRYMLEALRSDPDHWKLRGEFSVPAVEGQPQCRIFVYGRSGPMKVKRGDVVLSLPYTLGKTIRHSDCAFMEPSGQ